MFAILLFTMFSYSCNDIIEIDLPKNQLTDEKVFADSANAHAAIIGIYINMMQAFSLDFCSGGITTFPAMSADELNQTGTNINDEFFANNISSTNSTISYLWVSAYSYIYGVNACMEGIEKSQTITSGQKESLVAEAKFIRAFIYFYLANLYGNIPVVKGTDYQVNRLLSQSPLEDVYLFIKQDIDYARKHLPNHPNMNTRPNYYAATALMARISLYEKNYDLAELLATEVIEDGGYELEPSPETVFGGNSRETIWSLMPVVNGRATWEGYYHLPPRATSVPSYIITEPLLDSFEDNDARKSDWVGGSTIRGVQYFYPNKYKMYAANTTDNEKYVVLRLAEQYLIRAEARAHLSNFHEAQSDINMIRTRAGLEDFQSNSDLSQLLSEIEKQRRFELMCEWGHRWFDLKRTGRIDAVLSAVKQNWTSPASLYPIPQSELNSSPNLIQNPNY